MKLDLKILTFVCLILCGLSLTSCHRALVTSNSTPVYYSDSKFINLLPTQAMVGSIDELQHMEGTLSKGAVSDSRTDTSSTSFNSDVWVRANDTVLSIVLFGSFATTIAELTYAHDSIHFESSLMDVEKMKAEYVIADLQACFYPFEALQKNFAGAGFTFTENRELITDLSAIADSSAADSSVVADTLAVANTTSDLDFERVLTDDGITIFRIVRKGNEIDFVNELRHYKYHITLSSD